jgi:hypothetical protein
MRSITALHASATATVAAKVKDDDKIERGHNCTRVYKASLVGWPARA